MKNTGKRVLIELDHSEWSIPYFTVPTNKLFFQYFSSIIIVLIKMIVQNTEP